MRPHTGASEFRQALGEEVLEGAFHIHLNVFEVFDLRASEYSFGVIFYSILKFCIHTFDSEMTSLIAYFTKK